MGLDLWCVGACLCWICGGSRLVVCRACLLVGLDLWCVGACLCWICGGSRLVVCRSISVLDMWWV